MATKIQHTNFPISMLAMDDEKGIIEAIVSVTSNKDRGGERVMPGFFAKSLQKKMPRGVWCHDWTKPIAKTLVAEEWLAGDSRLPEKIRDLGGYYVKGQFNLETQRGREAYSDLKFGTIDEFSIGYLVEKETFNKTVNSRDLIEGEWFEWSPVLVGMNPATAMISIKSAGDVDVKGQYLGDYIEASMTMGACGRAVDALYWMIVDCIYDEQMSMDERLAQINGAYNEARDLTLMVIQAILAGTAEDTPEMAVKFIQQNFCNPADYDDRLSQPRTGLVLAKHSEAALTAVQGLVKRIQQVAEWKAANRATKAGAVLSQANRQLIQTCVDGMSQCTQMLTDLLDSTDPNKEEKALAEAQAAYAKAQLLAAELAATGV